MRFFRYIIILLLIGLSQLLGNWPLTYTPEFIYTVAFYTALNTTKTQSLLLLFTAGIICDLFTGKHLGINTFSYTSSALIIHYFKNAFQSRYGVLELLLFGLCLLYILFFRLLLENSGLMLESICEQQLNNFLFTLLLAPVIYLLLQLPIICPWKKYSS